MGRTRRGRRVLYNAAGDVPWLAAVTVDRAGLHITDALRASLVDMDPLGVRLGATRILTRFLTVVGNLTADVLTPSLHHELDRTEVVEADAEATDETRPQRGEREGKV